MIKTTLLLPGLGTFIARLSLLFTLAFWGCLSSFGYEYSRTGTIHIVSESPGTTTANHIIKLVIGNDDPTRDDNEYTFYFDGDGYNSNLSAPAQIEVVMGRSYDVTVINGGGGIAPKATDYRIFMKSDYGSVDQEPFYFEIEGGSNSNYIDMGDVDMSGNGNGNGDFSFRAIPTGPVPLMGALDYMRAFGIDKPIEANAEYHSLLESVSISLGRDAAGKWNGVLEVPLFNGTDANLSYGGVKLYAGPGGAIEKSIPSGGKLVETVQHDVEILPLSGSSGYTISFYPKSSSSAILVYTFMDGSPDAELRISREIDGQIDYFDWDKTSNGIVELDAYPWYPSSGAPEYRIEVETLFELNDDNVNQFYVLFESQETIYRDLSNNAILYKEFRNADGEKIIGESEPFHAVNPDPNSSSFWYRDSGWIQPDVHTDGFYIGMPFSSSRQSDDDYVLGVTERRDARLYGIEYYESALGEVWPEYYQRPGGAIAYSYSESERGTISEVDYLGELQAVVKTVVDSSGEVTEKLSFIRGLPNTDIAGKPIYQVEPDGSKTCYTYSRGYYYILNGSLIFSETSNGDSLRVRSYHGKHASTSSSISYGGDVITEFAMDWVDDKGAGYDIGRSTMEEVIYSESGNPVCYRDYVFAENGMEHVQSLYHSYDPLGNLLKSFTYQSGSSTIASVLYEAGYVGGRLDYEIDQSGMRTDYSYSLSTGRLSSSTLAGSPSVLTTYGYDAMGRRTSETVVGSGETLQTTRKFDDAGRLKEEAPGGFVTKYTYGYTGTQPTQRTVDYWGTSDDVISSTTTVNNIFGEVFQQSGTTIPSATYSYIENWNDIATTVTYDSGQESTTYYDWKGRVIQEDVNVKSGTGWSESTLSTIYDYNNKGQLVEQAVFNGSTQVSPSTLFLYDDYGRLQFSGTDVDESGNLSAGVDANMRYYYSHYEKRPGFDWWRYESEFVYLDENSSAHTVDLQAYEVISGFDQTRIAESFGHDRYGNWVESETQVDRANAKVTTVVNMPGSSTDTESVTVNGFLTTETNAQGQVSTYAYDSLGRLGSMTDARNLTTNYNYFPNTVLVEEIIEADGQSTTFGYDNSGLQSSVEDHLGNKAYSSYNHTTRTQCSWGKTVNPSKSVFDEFGRQVELHTYQSISAAQESSSSIPSPMNSAGDKTTWVYDADTGQLKSELDADDKELKYYYDIAGRVSKTTDARSVDTYYRYYDSGIGAADSFTGLLREVEYDTEDTDAEGTPKEQYEYHKRTLVTSKMRQETYEGSNVWNDWSYEYDSLGNIEKESLPWRIYGQDHDQIEYSYQSDGGSPSDSVVNGRISGFNVFSTFSNQYDYSNQGRLEKITLGHASGTQDFHYAYKSNCNLIETIHGKSNGSTKQRQYRGYANNNYAQTQMHTSGTSTSANVTDVNVLRDDLKRIQEHAIEGWVGSQAAGDGYGLWEEYGYTARSEVNHASKRFMTSSGSSGTPISYDTRNFDSMGNRETTGTITIAEDFEDGLGFWSVPGASQGYKNWYLDQGGTVSGSTGPKYDATTGNTSGTYLYMETSKDDAISNGDEAVVESQMFIATSSSFINFRYHMYGSEMGTLWFEVYNSTTDTWTSPWSLSGEQHISDTSAYSTGSVNLSSYNNQSIRIRFRGEAAGGYRGDMAIDNLTLYNVKQGGFETNELNQYTQLSNNGVWFDSNAGLNQGYDLAGNLTYDGLYTYTYDAKHQLVAIASVNSSANYRFEYDPLGRRVARSGTSPPPVRYMYQGWNLIAELEEDEDWAIVKKFTWGLDASNSLQGAGGVGGLLMIEDGSTRYYPVYDLKQNVIGLQDSTGDLVAWYEYDAFGKLVGSGGAAADINPFRFSTKYTDHEIDPDMVYYGLRYYHAELGRFLNRDPIGEAGGLNLYGFVGNNPTNAYDYLGMQSKPQDPHESGGDVSEYEWELYQKRLREWEKAEREDREDAFNAAYSDFIFETSQQNSYSPQNDQGYQDSGSEQGYVAAPEELIGTRDYYLFRNDNAPASYTNGEGPNYYIDYGLEFFDRFAALRASVGDSNSTLVDFIDRAKVELQLELEAALAADPAIGLNRSLTMLAAFDSHSTAYLNAGFADVGFDNKLTVLWTVKDGLFSAGVGAGLKELVDSYPVYEEYLSPKIVTGIPDGL